MFGFIVYNKSSRPVHLKKSKEQQDLYQNEKQKLWNNIQKVMVISSMLIQKKTN